MKHPAEVLKLPAEDFSHPAEDLLRAAENFLHSAEDFSHPAEDLKHSAERLKLVSQRIVGERAEEREGEACACQSAIGHRKSAIHHADAARLLVRGAKAGGTRSDRDACGEAEANAKAKAEERPATNRRRPRAARPLAGRGERGPIPARHDRPLRRNPADRDCSHPAADRPRPAADSGVKCVQDAFRVRLFW